jgi:hypothetical protein
MDVFPSSDAQDRGARDVMNQGQRKQAGSTRLLNAFGPCGTQRVLWDPGIQGSGRRWGQWRCGGRKGGGERSGGAGRRRGNGTLGHRPPATIVASGAICAIAHLRRLQHGGSSRRSSFSSPSAPSPPPPASRLPPATSRSAPCLHSSPSAARPHLRRTGLPLAVALSHHLSHLALLDSIATFCCFSFHRALIYLCSPSFISSLPLILLLLSVASPHNNRLR